MGRMYCSFVVFDLLDFTGVTNKVASDCILQQILPTATTALVVLHLMVSQIFFFRHISDRPLVIRSTSILIPGTNKALSMSVKL